MAYGFQQIDPQTFYNKSQDAKNSAITAYRSQTTGGKQTSETEKSAGGALSSGVGAAIAGQAAGSAMASATAGGMSGSAGGWWGAGIGAVVGLASYYLS